MLVPLLWFEAEDNFIEKSRCFHLSTPVTARGPYGKHDNQLAGLKSGLPNLFNSQADRAAAEWRFVDHHAKVSGASATAQLGGFPCGQSLFRTNGHYVHPLVTFVLE